ncbi:MAG: hypothetical protein HY954_03925 [Deltaproteobacteria bacterium]|nr:hypothetical protein [Deltaproteobacteria bacterium]
MKIVRFLAFLIVCASAESLLSAPVLWGVTPEEAASDIYGSYGESYGSIEDFKERVSEPMTSGDTLMYTLDGSKSFNAQISCPSTSKFLEVSISVLSSGDLKATIKQDTDFDENPDYTYVPPTDISGVCSNGVVSCDEGTWKNCKYYLWTADIDNFQVALLTAPMTELGGCYCINQSCGASYSDYSSVLEDIGGGAAGAIQNADARFSITDADVADDSISYYGQDTADCTGEASTGTSSLQEYYTDQNDGSLVDASDAEILDLLEDTSSAYYNVMESFDNSSTGIYVTSCDVKRSATIDTETYTATGSSAGSSSICVDYYLYARIYENGDDYYLQIYDTGPGDEPHNNCDSEGAGDMDGWHTLEVVTLPQKATSLYFCVTASGTGCSSGTSNCVSVAGSKTLLLTCTGNGAQNPSYDYSYDLKYKEDTLVESTDDKCKTLAADTDCKLRKETVDGVTTYSNFNPTNYTVPNTCQTFTGVESHEVCRDWWSKSREYYCYGEESDFDFSEVEERTDTVLSTSLLSGSTLYYDDYRKSGSGGFSTFNEAVKLYDSGDHGDCIKVCKVRVPETDTQAGMSGTTADYRTDTGSDNTYYKKCADGQCELDTEEGEELMEDCACPDDFAEAASIMSALEEASDDIICSNSGGW